MSIFYIHIHQRAHQQYRFSVGYLVVFAGYRNVVEFEHNSQSDANCCLRAARFINRDYGQTTSVSELISELRWQSLEDRRNNARLSLFYKGLHGLAAIPVNELQRPTRCTRYCGADTFTVMSSRIDAYKFSFLPRTVTDWNALPPSTRANQSTDSFKKALYKLPDDSTYHC